MSNNGGNLTVQYNLRWSEELRDKIAEEAKKNTRSMNQEIIARLEQSFEDFPNKDKELAFLKEINESRAEDIKKLLNMVEQLLKEKK